MSVRGYLTLAVIAFVLPGFASSQETTKRPEGDQKKAVEKVNADGELVASRTFLLHVTQGQLPTDLGTKATKISTAESKELGGKALKVELADSVGDRITRVADWRSYKRLGFDAFNPGRENVAVAFTVLHKQSTNYATRIDLPVVLKPGMNEVRWKMAEIKNTNGAPADLANIIRWYIAIQGPPSTLLLGDVWLEGSKVSSNPSQSKVVVHGDPARLERIRAARMPKIDKPVLFDTPEADAILSALEIFPQNNPWNLVVEDWPLHPNSKNIIASIGAGKPLRYNPDMGFVLVSPDQKKAAIKITGYPDESDKGPFPVPDNVPIEGWPVYYQRSNSRLTLDQVQRNLKNDDSDRHAILVDPVNRMLYEFFQLKKTDAGWQAAQSSVFDLKSNKLRPDGWTSTDAAGLPIFPSVVRYDELKRGQIEHALRVTVVKSRRAYVYPATHFASRHTDKNLPRMGERVRLRRDFPISGFSPEVTAILQGLKKYGMLVADNGIDWAISVAPDPRIPVLHEELRKIQGSDFEVIEPPSGYVPPNE